MRRAPFLSALALSCCALGSTLAAQERIFKVIVNAENPINEMKKEQVSTLFLNRSARWAQLGSAAPVDQSMSSPVREAFAKQVLGQSLEAIQAYWQKRILNEHEIPPPVKSSDDEVIAHVAKNKGGIGYVATGAALPPTVKAVRLVD